MNGEKTLHEVSCYVDAQGFSTYAYLDLCPNDITEYSKKSIWKIT